MKNYFFVCIKVYVWLSEVSGNSKTSTTHVIGAARV